jgi:hypothetical protein
MMRRTFFLGGIIWSGWMGGRLWSSSRHMRQVLESIQVCGETFWMTGCLRCSRVFWSTCLRIASLSSWRTRRATRRFGDVARSFYALSKVCEYSGLFVHVNIHSLSKALHIGTWVGFFLIPFTLYCCIFCYFTQFLLVLRVSQVSLSRMVSREGILGNLQYNVQNVV